MRHFFGCVVAAVAMLSSPARADTPADVRADDTAQKHRGFFLRLDLGAGYQGSSSTLSATDVSISGMSGAFGIALGGAVSDGVILGAHLFDVVASSPTVQAGSQSATASNAQLALLCFGPNATFYVMPANVYFSITVGVAVLTASRNGTTNNTQTGVGGRLQLGKEWWASEHWGLGLAAHLTLARNDDTSSSGATPPTWTTVAGGVLFSATFN